jgi:succinoglycan biosynthesis protein ExoA
VPAVTHISRISVIVPMLNEAAHVEQLATDLALQDFTGEIEVIVADGGSTDGSIPLFLASAERLGLTVRVVDNPAGWVSQGLNTCIGQATGDLIARLDCHSRYPADYLRRCAETSETTGADNVGGTVIARGRTPIERAVASAMDSPFGGIGWTRHERGGGPVDVDTVTFGAFRPEAFRRAGLFDESLRRNQDDEFNLRLRLHGGRIILDPSIKLFYTPRGSLRAVFRQYFEYGRWKVPVMRKHRRVLGLRSLAPAAFILSLLALLATAAIWALAAWVLAIEVVTYAAFAVGFGLASLRRRRESIRLLPWVVSAYAAFHVGYGLGMLRGFVSSHDVPLHREAHRDPTSFES